jgi:phosphoribosyl-ATP pyrophosphohydrolase/phosphoribosyl-AMP cyclohydrolase
VSAPGEIAWPASGLVPVVIVDDRTGAVLTLAYANEEALDRTLATRSTWLFSRSRGELWNKGATSGNTQEVVAVAVDCDSDALMYRVVPHGPACHTGAASCFETRLRLDPPGERRAAAAPAKPGGGHPEPARPALAAARSDPAGARFAERSDPAGARFAERSDPAGARFAAAVGKLAATIGERKRTPVEGSYTSKLFAGGVDRIGKKIGEEATEVVIAAKNADRNELIWETADLLYHTLVLLAQREIGLDEVGAELARRATPRG